MAEDKANAKATRTQKPIYAVMQVMDKEGNPMAISKDNVRVVGGFKDADGVLDIMESGAHPNAFYKKIPLG